MAVLNPRTPVQTFLACTAVDASVTFAEAMGSIYIINTGANPVWVNLNNAAAVGSDGVGRTQLLANGGSLNLDDTSVSAVHGICGAALTSTLQIVAHPRPGGSGGGLG